jgi:hypothetical protein
METLLGVQTSMKRGMMPLPGGKPVSCFDEHDIIL